MVVGSGKSKSNNRSNSSSRKRREEIIKTLQTTVLKDHATAEGLTLLVGALSRKVEVFSTKLGEMDEYVENIKKLTSSVETMDGTIDELGAEVDTYKEQTDERFRKTHRNFGVITNKLGDFIFNELSQSDSQFINLLGIHSKGRGDWFGAKFPVVTSISFSLKKEPWWLSV